MTVHLETRTVRARSALDGLLSKMVKSDIGCSNARSAAESGADESRMTGIVAARAVLDAGIDVGFERWVHSVSVSFLDTSITDGDLSATIESRRDTLLHSTRGVQVTDSTHPVASCVVSFEAPPRGRHRPHLYGVGETPDPHTVARFVDASMRTGAGRLLPLDVRPVEGFGAPSARDANRPMRAWLRFEDELPDDLLVHAAALSLGTEPVLAYALRTINGHNALEGNPLVAGWQPLNYSLWFHRCFRADDWVLLTQQSTSIFGNRAFVSATIHSSQGRHIASVAQEHHLIR